jgi:hypothetical protein
MRSLLLELYQFDPVLEDVETNARRIADRAAVQGAAVFDPSPRIGGFPPSPRRGSRRNARGALGRRAL